MYLPCFLSLSVFPLSSTKHPDHHQTAGWENIPTFPLKGLVMAWKDHSKGVWMEEEEKNESPGVGVSADSAVWK